MTPASQPELFDGDLLGRRLAAHGLRGFDRIEFHENRSVMVSVTERNVLRVHRGFAYAPDAVLAALVGFVDPATRRRRRADLRRVVLGFPVHDFVPGRRPRRRTRPRREDAPVLRRLAACHRDLNARCFDGALGEIRFRLSRRMARRLGEIALDPVADTPLEIAISHRHVERDGWAEVEHTLLHEMIHQWQAESGMPVDHGAAFRAKARAVGIEPRAARRVD